MSNSGPKRGRSALFIGRYFGIEFYLDYSWFIIAAILVFSLATVAFPELDAPLRRPQAVYVTMAFFGAILFFLSILLHELGHSLVSQRCGIPVPRITLLFIGGLAEIAREPDDARSELKIALGGPAVTVLLIAVFAGFSMLCEWLNWIPAALVCAWLAVANAFLLIFNMIPGYPLDGGRVLRALIWARTGRLRKATYISSRIGVALCYLLFAIGFYAVVAHNHWGSITLIVVAFFLKGAAEAGYSNAIQRELLGSLRVADLMVPHLVAIPDSLPLNLVADDFFLAHHRLSFPVCGEDQQFRGILSLKALHAVPRAKWPFTAAGEVACTDKSGCRQIDLNDTASRALQLLQIPGQEQLAVVDQGRLVGVLTRADLMRIIKIRTQFEA